MTLCQLERGHSKISKISKMCEKSISGIQFVALVKTDITAWSFTDKQFSIDLSTIDLDMICIDIAI